VASLSAVVLAPHYDDEVLGCGGLLARLARAGTRVHVVFLSDGSGGDEVPVGDPGAARTTSASQSHEAPAPDDRAAYAARRRAEAEQATRALGIASSEHLGLRDGSLRSSLERLRGAIERTLAERRPDLVLVPSPLEITDDHRAAFAALHDALTGVRVGDDRYAALAGLRILVYEVNHPAYPDLLVDVTAERETISSAMAHYASQLERHDYLAAALGLRSYRCLTLPPAVKLAEGYRRLGLDDFRVRSLGQLVTALGGTPDQDEIRNGPAVSVVVRTKDRQTLLTQALASLAASTYRAIELVLVNDGGAAPAVPDDFPFPVRRVDLRPNRGRAGAANAGVEVATGAYVLFLDDDDVIAPEHVATLVGLASRSGARVVYTDAAVGVYEPDAATGWSARERSVPYSRDFDPDLLLLDNYIPFHTVLVERSLYGEVGRFDESLEFFEDWDLLVRLSRRVRFQHLARVTCEYRHFRGAAHALGEEASTRADFVATKGRVLDKHRALLTGDALARAVVTLRREAVEAHLRAAALQESLAELERRYHLRNGELQSVREESDRRAAALDAHERDFARMFREEETLRRGVDEQLAHLGRTYAEIERLNGLIVELQGTIGEMKSTRAWRLHEWWQEHRPSRGQRQGGGKR
jgi:LmbE family N-acetylglucosaminyl deacetylase